MIEVRTCKAEHALVPLEHDPGATSEFLSAFGTFRFTGSKEHLQTFPLAV